jgi:hypothetical protein
VLVGRLFLFSQRLTNFRRTALRQNRLILATIRLLRPYIYCDILQELNTRRSQLQKGPMNSSNGHARPKFAFSSKLFAVFLLSLFAAARSHGEPLDPAAAQKVKDAAKQGYPLAVSADVSGNVSIEAVLIPPKVAREVFSGTVSSNYAVISLTISNHSKDTSLIVHSIFMDYSRWLLSGNYHEDENCHPAGDSSDSNAKSPQQCNDLTPHQAQTRPNQIASVESRIVRGQLLDRQAWTARNWVVRALVAAGSVASAYTFTLTGEHVIESVSAYNGQVIPAVQAFWPDATIGQMNRLNDMGFQVNKVIPRESSDIIVAFFPIDRFLTPGLKKVFTSSPSLFFATSSVAIDSRAQKQLLPLFEPLVGKENKASLQTAIHGLPNAIKNEGKAASGGSCPTPSQITAECLLQILNLASLNRVRLVVGGTLTVDVNTVPPKIDSIDLIPPTGNSLSAALAEKGSIQGVVNGSFLAGGQITVAQSDELHISKIDVDTKKSTDKQLFFTLMLNQGLTSTATKLSFQVGKSSSDGSSVQSPVFDVPVSPGPPPPAARP